MADTIFALATPPGRSGVAVIRVSGPSAFRCAAALGARNAPLRAAVLRRLIDPGSGGVLDTALVLRFAGPGSFTGEDTVEFHLHGGPAVCKAIGSALAALPDVRGADPGEFTRRALLNGKLDLAQVEGLGDLLAAETASQAKQARALMDGALSTAAADWRCGLIRALAAIEASIDFSDEELPDTVLDGARDALAGLVGRFEREVAGSVASERIRTGFEVALVGAPNVGKSTLLNALAGREAAITSALAGTTRDVIEVRMDLGGLAVTIVDMAGLRDPADPLEAIGVDRARRRAASADLRIFLLDDEEALAGLGVTVEPGDQIVGAKADLRPAPAGVSGITGQGVPPLLERIVAELGRRVATAGLVGHVRQRAAVERALAAVRSAQRNLDAPLPLVELAAADLHAAVVALDVLMGKVDVESVLDEIFSRFCLGK